MTATHKVNKPTLRRMLWGGEDPVYERVGESYVRLSPERAEALHEQFAEHGREQLLRA